LKIVFPIQKRNNWWCRYGCKLCTRHQQAYQGSSSSFIAYNNVANPLIVKALLFLCGLKQTHIQESTIFIYVTKTTFLGNIFTLVEGTGPATTMLMKNHIQRRNT
jgi:hypothetical protein